MRFISKGAEDWKDKKVLLRASLNVPLDNSGKISSLFRIKRALPTIKTLAKNSKSLIIIAHIGKGEKDSLYPVFLELKKHIKNLQFVTKDGYFKEKSEGVFLMENLRAFEGETKNDPDFAKRLASLADIFVQDAFAVLHREHASVVGLPKFLPSFAGFSVKRELKALKKALKPKSKSAFVLGGAKLSTKEPLLKKMLGIYDKVLLGGALANEALAARGFEVGLSKIEDGQIDPEVLNHPHLFLPEKYTVVSDSSMRKSDGTDIRKDEKILDAFAPMGFLHGVDFLLWNGPLGYYEAGFVQGSASLISQIEIFKPEAYLGGGDSNAIVEELHKEDIFAFRSSGGGSTLYFLENETLPGLEAISNP